MKIERTKNTYRNMIWGIGQQVVAVVFPFIIRTAVIKILGSEYLGLNNLFSSILQVLNLAEAGFSSAIVFSMYKPIAEDDYKKIRELLSYYRKAYQLIGTIILVGGLCILPFLDRMISGTHPSDINIYILYLIYLFNTVISYFLFSYKACLLTAHQRNDVYSRIIMFVTLAQNILQIIVLFVWENYYLYIIMLPIAAIATNIGCAVITKKMYPNLYCEGQLANEDKVLIKEKIYGLIIGKINTTTKNSFDSIFISAFLGLVSVAIYGNYYYVMMAVHRFLATMVVSASAGVGNSVVLESVDKNFQDYKKFDFLYNWVSSWCTVCLFILYQPFMELWVGVELVASMPVMIIFCVYFYILCLGDIQSIYSSAKGLWWENRIFYIPEAIANIILNYLLAKTMGIFGVILASVITALFIGNVGDLYILFKHYFKDKSLLSIWRRRFYYVIVLVIVCLTTYFVSIRFDDLNLIPQIFVKLIICIIIPNMLFWLFFRNIKEYKQGKDIVMKIVGKFIK